MTAVIMAVLIAAPPAPAVLDRGALSQADLDAARIAWRYFERNYQSATGLVNSVDGYPSTSSWDLGSTLLATVAAQQLGLLDPESFARRINAVLRTLTTQPLFRGMLPNKAYDTRSGAMTNYANEPVAAGIGWSALDVARLASALQILARFYPEHRDAIVRVLERWNSCDLVRDGQLHGAIAQPAGGVAIVQEGRLGYEQYAAHALERLGFDLRLASSYERFATTETILGVAVRRDTRDQRTFDAVDALVTEPWVLDAMEFGVGEEEGLLLDALFEVQKRRWQETGLLTAASEDHVDRAPWFVYGAVWAGGAAWRTVTTTGGDAAPLSGASTKAAFALAALYREDPYAEVLRTSVAALNDPERGWFAGLYDRGEPNRALTANTNGVILETLLWKAAGALHGPDAGQRLAPRTCSASAGAPGPAAGASSAFGPVPGRDIRRPPTSGRNATPALRLDGSVFGGYRGADRGTMGAVATLWLFGSSYVRIGGEGTPQSPYGTARFLWGLGYDDWRDRTFFAHVDNWGPIRPGDGFAIRQAEATAGYKLPQLCVARAVCAAPLASVVAPFAGGPYLHGRMTIAIARNWFVMGGIGWTIPDVFEGPAGTPKWRVVYGFGRTDWRPGGLFVTYHDWGPDSRRGNGILAIGVNWGL